MPKVKPTLPPESPLSYRLTKEEKDRYEGMSLDEIVVELASSSNNKVDIAGKLISGIKEQDATAWKAFQEILSRQGFGEEKELPISDERFKQIIKTAAEYL